MVSIAPVRLSIPASASAPVRGFTADQAAIDKLSKHMQNEVLGEGMFTKVGHGDIPAIDLVPAKGSTTLVALQSHDKNSDGMKYEGPAKYKVDTVPADKMLDFTLLVPVSGHCGREDATAWAGLDPKRLNDTNTYNVRITFPDGTKKELNGLKAQGYISALNISLPAQAGKTKIEYWPDGSADVSGYPSGRTLWINV